MTEINYDREKLVQINDTPIACIWEAAEAPTGETAVPAGSTAQLTATVTADADESGGADIQDLFKLTAALAIDSVTGKTTLAIVVTPVMGDASDAPAQTLAVVTHPEDMDAWQSAAGRARQT